MKKKLLKELISNRNHHARWLNTLAFLEHIGSRKLIKSQDSRQIDLDMLDHIAEETRHSAFLKRLLKKKFPDRCPTFEEHYLLGDPEAYFQSLDFEITEILMKSDRGITLLPYAYVTLLIETRALTVYKTYQSCLFELDIPIRLSSIVKEEEAHLASVRKFVESKDLNYEQRWQKFSKIEKECFDKFIIRIERTIDGNQSVDMEAIYSNEVSSSVF